MPIKIKGIEGFTLIELLVYMSILSILFVGVTTIAFTISSSYQMFQYNLTSANDSLFLTNFVSTLIKIGSSNLVSENASSSMLTITTEPNIYNSLSVSHVFSIFQKDNQIVMQRDNVPALPLFPLSGTLLPHATIYFEKKLLVGVSTSSNFYVSTTSIIDMKYITSGKVMTYIFSP